MAAELLRAKTSFFCATSTGDQYDIAAGQVVKADHPAVKGREKLFESLEDQALGSSPRARR